MNLLSELFRDECGALVSAELVLLGTIGVVGATVGLSVLSTAVNAELNELAYAVRSLDQSYAFRGFRSCRAYSAGSCYTQPSVEDSLASLCVGEADEIQDELPHSPIDPSEADVIDPMPMDDVL